MYRDMGREKGAPGTKNQRDFPAGLEIGRSSTQAVMVYSVHSVHAEECMPFEGLAATTEAKILTRVIKPGKRGLPAAAARAILQLDFDDEDRRRMHELAQKNQVGELTPEERSELEGYMHIGLLLDLLHSKARRSLKQVSSRR